MPFTRVLVKKLARFWILSLLGVGLLCALIVSLSYVQLTYQYQQQKVNELEAMLANQFQATSAPALEPWLSSLLHAYGVRSFRLSRHGELLSQYQAPGERESSAANSNDSTDVGRGIVYEAKFGPDASLSMQLRLPSPLAFERPSIDKPGWQIFVILLATLAAIGGLLRVGYRWFVDDLKGMEALVARSKLILSGNLDEAAQFPVGAKPKVVNRAMSRLFAELRDAQKERARFDNFIRSNTFLDPQTRIGNQLFLQNRLDALANEQGMMMPGVLYLLQLDELDLLQQEVGDGAVTEFLSGTINALNRVLQTQANSIFARRATNQLAIVVPQISLSEADSLAESILKICLAQPLPASADDDNFFHLGGAYFKEGDLPELLWDEANMALRAAELQGSNGWFMYDKGAVDKEFAKGSVRWRSMLENALAQRQFVSFVQPVCESDNSRHHYEVFTRVRDPMGGLVRAMLFMPMAIKCGLMPQIERQVVEQTLFELLPRAGNDARSFSINLSMESLTNRPFVRWLQTTLLEQRHLTSRLVFEIAEDIVLKHRHELESSLNMLRKIGVRLCVDHVGQQVVSTQYIKELGFDFIKLHRSVIRQIDLRPENQLFVRSLIGSLYRTEVQVFAEGVGCFEEWQTLRILGVSAAQGSYFGEPQEA